jgi:hypothetical protein
MHSRGFLMKKLIAAMTAAFMMVAFVSVAPQAATMAASCTTTGFSRDGIDLTAAQIGGAVTGDVDATGCDIGVYNPTSVTGADIHGARYYGVVVNGLNVNTTNSKVHQIGNDPFDGTQHGRAITYINGASGTISGNQVYDFQKNGIEVIELAADGASPTSFQTSATVKNNVVTGEGAIAYIAQNGIVIRNGASASVKNNTVSGFFYTPADTEATGLLLYDNAAGTVTASANKFADNEVNMYGVTPNKGGHVKP